MSMKLMPTDRFVVAAGLTFFQSGDSLDVDARSGGIRRLRRRS
jgi:hypothetical protein